MSIAESIIKNQDRDAMLQRQTKTVVDLYADKTHFIYELLQNAEDAGATKVFFIQNDKSLSVLHDGLPFTRSNVQSLCDSSNSDKKYESGKIGKFGVGFKSVFQICTEVQLHSNPKSRPISDALPAFAIKIDGFINPTDIPQLNIAAPYTTLFIFPYAHQGGDYYKSEELLKIDISRKLKNLGTSVLLFMKNIAEIRYNIGEINEESDGEGTYSVERVYKERNNFYRITAEGETNGKKGKGNYFLFSRPIENSPGHTVDIAYSVTKRNGRTALAKTDSPYVSVYFPMETESKLNFIVQAPFDTTPNRSSLKGDSDKNAALIRLLAELFEESLLTLKAGNVLDMESIDLLPYGSYNPQWQFYLLHIKAEHLLTEEQIIPAISGGYIHAKNAKIQDGIKLLELFKDDLLCKILKQPDARWLPATPALARNAPLRKFLVENGAEVISPSDDLPRLFRANPNFLYSMTDSWLAKLYNYIAEDLKSLIGKNASFATVPYIKTFDGKLNAAFEGDGKKRVEKIYKRPLNAHFNLSGFLFVADFVAENCRPFLNLLDLPEPNAFDWFISNIRHSVSSLPTDSVNIENVKDAIKFMRKEDDVAEKIKPYLKLRVFDHEKQQKYVTADGKCEIYFPQDKNGVPLTDYLLEVTTSWHFNSHAVYVLDADFYLLAGLGERELLQLKQLGVQDDVSIYSEKTAWTDGKAQCNSVGNFRKKLDFRYKRDVLNDIKNRRGKEPYIAKRKSAAMFQLLLSVEKHLKGQYLHGISNPEARSGFAAVVDPNIADSLSNSQWLFAKDGSLKSPKNIAILELDEAVYGKPERRSEIYEILGFKKTSEDSGAQAISSFLSQYSKREQQLILNELLKRVKVQQDDEDVFDPDVDETAQDFPNDYVKDMVRLNTQISDFYKNSRAVRYDIVERRVRTSRGDDREYMRARYHGFCQSCKHPSRHWEIAEIFLSPKKELEQMNLSLCPNCASEYRVKRNDKIKMEQFKSAISLSSFTSFPCEVKLDRDMSIFFTMRHFAEVQRIIFLMKSD